MGNGSLVGQIVWLTGYDGERPFLTQGLVVNTREPERDEPYTGSIHAVSVTGPGQVRFWDLLHVSNPVSGLAKTVWTDDVLLLHPEFKRELQQAGEWPPELVEDGQPF